MGATPFELNEQSPRAHAPASLEQGTDLERQGQQPNWLRELEAGGDALNWDDCGGSVTEMQKRPAKRKIIWPSKCLDSLMLLAPI